MSADRYISHDRPGLAGELRASRDASALVLQAANERRRGRTSVASTPQAAPISAVEAVPMAVAAPASAAAPAPSPAAPAATPQPAAPSPRGHLPWHDMSLVDLDRF